MIIIGVLAAIAIPVFLNQRRKAQDSAAKADVTTLGKELATYFVDSCKAPTIGAVNAHWELTVAAATAADAPCTTPTTAIVTGTPAADLGKQSNNVTLLSQHLVDDSNWCVSVQNLKGDSKQFKYSAKNGMQAGDCVLNTDYS